MVYKYSFDLFGPTQNKNEILLPFAKHFIHLVRFFLRESGRCSIILHVAFLEESEVYPHPHALREI